MSIRVGMLVALSAVFGLATCGKEVIYDEVVEVDVTDDVGAVYCLLGCESVGDEVLRPLVELEFSVPTTNHNQQMCESVRLHGTMGKTVIGCNLVGNPHGPVTVTSKLRNPGDCQRVTLYTEMASPGNVNSNQHPGHYEVCTETSDTIWADVEDWVGVEDFNDSQFRIRATGGQLLEWNIGNNGQLFICVSN